MTHFFKRWQQRFFSHCCFRWAWRASDQQVSAEEFDWLQLASDMFDQLGLLVFRLHPFTDNCVGTLGNRPGRKAGLAARRTHCIPLWLLNWFLGPATLEPCFHQEERTERGTCFIPFANRPQPSITFTPVLSLLVSWQRLLFSEWPSRSRRLQGLTVALPGH